MKVVAANLDSIDRLAQEKSARTFVHAMGTPQAIGEPKLAFGFHISLSTFLQWSANAWIDVELHAGRE